jgi:SAM-dependent methyltransferase
LRPSADTLLVWTGAPCSYGCGACPIDPRTAPAGMQPADLQRSLATAPADAGRLVVLVGGEPFLRRDLPPFLAVIRAAGCAPGIVTTGRALVYPQVRARLRRGGLAYLRLQLFGVGAAHDRATRTPGAFDQALAALRAWVAEADGQCDVDVALSTRSRPIETAVSEIADLAREMPSPQVQIVIAVDPALGAESRDTDSVRRAVSALAQWNTDPTRPLLAWEGLPETDAPASCLTIPLRRPRFAATTPHACCLGVLDEMAGATPVAPDMPRANSFNFVSTTTSVPWTAEAGACTAHQAAGGVEPYRHVWLVDGERLVLHVTDTGDFAPAAIARIKDELSHLFVDRAPAGVLDDFTEGMRRVLPDPICDACAHRGRCGRRVGRVDGPPFAREEAWISRYIAGLRGRVLDVGCGEQLYRNVIGPLIRSATVQYTGLDPDDASLASLRTAFPEGRFHVGGIEDFRGEPASYDHILCLRSLNHVVDLDEAVARMARLLKPGGRLLLVECTPFAMLREPAQVAAADRAPRAGHQHFRNVASEDVLPFARRRALRVLHHVPATRETTNEWILLLERAPAGVYLL